MEMKQVPDIDALFEEGAAIDAALKSAVREAAHE
jgi:hypothetical protein